MSLPLILLSIVAVAFAVPFNPTLFGIMLAALCVLAVALFVYLFIFENRIRRDIDNIFNENASIAKQIVSNINIPCLFCDTNGRIVWRNETFRVLFDGTSLKKLFDEDELSPTQHLVQKQIEGRHYTAVVMPVIRTNKHLNNMLFLYLLDRTEAIHYARLYNDNFPTVALIYVDNYEDLSAEQGFTRNAMINEVERQISDMAKSLNGVYRRFEGARFMLVFEAKMLKTLEERRFDILNSVRSIDTGIDQSATLSIGVGNQETIVSSYGAAQNALELALGRGGDQAVVKHGQDYRFYGGKNISTTKISRVRVRSVANAMRELMSAASDIYVMGHRRADLDCVGAGLGILRCAEALDKKAHYVVEGGRETPERMMSLSLPDNISVKTPEAALEMFKKSTSLLIIVDTQRESLLCSKELYKKADKVVIIDHHRRSADAITSATISYTEPAASSACEMVTELVQCFYERASNMSLIATAMLAGIALDTKFFVFNTGVRTFDAAGYLRQCGADTGNVKRMFQDDMNVFAARSAIVENAEILDCGVAVAVCGNDVSNPILVAAQAADTLMSISGIQAAFVLANVNNMVSVSARSLGTINVQRICEHMGGGGHLTVAGAQLADVDMESAKKLVIDNIDGYIKEEKI